MTSLTTGFFVQNDEGSTLLHVAAMASNLDLTLKVLSTVKSPEQLDIVDDDGFTAIHYACCPPTNPKIVRALILAGANPNIQSDKYESALDIAVRYKQCECVKALSEQPTENDSKVFSQLCSVRTPKPIAVEHCCNPKSGLYPIHVAAYNNDTAMVQALIAAGANINERNGMSGYTALHIAVERSFTELIDLLANYPVTFVAETYGRLTPYQFAKKHRPLLAPLLKSKGAAL